MKAFFVTIVIVVAVFCFSFIRQDDRAYNRLYAHSLAEFRQEETALQSTIAAADLSNGRQVLQIRHAIDAARLKLKKVDFWLRYFEPVAYNRINGPLPVEWENEVFEKYEPPYRREGAGLSLAALYLDEKLVVKDSLVRLIEKSRQAINTFEADSITRQLNDFNHFFLANRLFLLNLAAIYNTGFECPDTLRIIPELRSMMDAVRTIYDDYSQAFPRTPLTKAYLDLYDSARSFVDAQPVHFSEFDQYNFIRNYVNPLFTLNQQFINGYGVISKNFNDYTLSNSNQSIFDKSLYSSQNTKGIYALVDNEQTLAEIRHIGKLLFYDPILSGNNQRSCASCHKSAEFFNDTAAQSALQFDRSQRLPRNTPTLINAIYNHLLMLDGKHISLQAQAKDVITNPLEMNSNPRELLKKVLSCREYREAFNELLKLTPEEKEIGLTHIISAITFYYGGFSQYYASFDDAMNKKVDISEEVQKGFNLFMSRAKCGTCHFVPYFNGVKPPYVSTEFEVIGTPQDSSFSVLSTDKGRYLVNPAPETMNAFRTGSLRNTEHTKPYMHNGVFHTLAEVVDFYDAGGGLGKKEVVGNQTLQGDSLKLSPTEKKELIAFLQSLNEKVIFEDPPASLPPSSNKVLNRRKVGGEY